MIDLLVHEKKMNNIKEIQIKTISTIMTTIKKTDFA